MVIMNSKAAYIITEGKFDSDLIKRLLPDLTDHPENIGVLTAHGYSSALSIVQSVLLETQRPVLLIVDADKMRIREKKAFIEQYVKINGLTCQIIVAEPELEILFFANKDVLERALQKPISDEVWTLAELSPRRGIELLTGQSRELASRQLLENEGVRQRIEQTSLVNEIRSFIQAAQQPVSV